MILQSLFFVRIWQISIIGVSELFTTGVSTYFLGIIYNIFLVQRSARIKHLFNLVCGLLICYLNFGFDIFFSLLSCLFTWSTIRVVGPCLKMVALNFAVCMAILIYGYHEKYSYKIDGFTWTMPQCVLTLSLIAMSFDVYDGHKNKPKENDSKLIDDDTVLEKIPSFLEILSKAYFPPSFLIGPQIKFKDYLNFVQSKENLLDVSYRQAILRLTIGIFYIIIYRFGINFWPLQFITKEEFKSYGFFAKLSIIALVNKIAFCKYISGWLIAEGACTMYGISLDPETKLFDRCCNVSVLHYETTATFRGIIESFNISTNQFAARYIYKRLKFMGSKLISHLLTLLFIAVWHGLYLGYYNTFALEFFIIKMETDIAEKVIEYRTKHKRINELLNTPSIKWLIYVAMRLHVIYMLSYAFTSLALMEYQKWTSVMSEVFYCGHFIYITWFVISIFIKSVSSICKSEKNEDKKQ